MQTLALKYRPKNFSELIGQGVIADSLSHALDSRRLGHAYLFSGLRGSGKTSSARIFAKALLCENGISSHPCEICENCKMAALGRHLDIIEMDAASHRKIDDIRDLIEQTKYAPSSARFKIFIIDEVHMLTKEAFNALLKTLEEPPEYIKFILATTDPLKLPATILSRTQHFRFKPISKNDIIKHLEYILNRENIKFEPTALEILARSGSGSLRDTLTLLDQAIIYSREFVSGEFVSEMLGILDPKEIDHILEVVSTQNKSELSNLIKQLSNADAAMIIDELIANLKIKFVSENSKFPLLIFERFFRILSEAKNMLSSGFDPEFVLYITLFMMIEAFNITNIDEAIQHIKTTPNLLNLQPKNQPNLAQSPKPNPQTPPKNQPYKIFLDRIYDRNYELGKCFDECISFDSFENNTLKLISKASGENQILLRKSSSVIMQILHLCFGDDAKIQIEKAKISDDDSMDRLLKSIGISSKEPQQDQLDEDLQNKQNHLKINSNIEQLNQLFGEPEVVEES